MTIHKSLLPSHEATGSGGLVEIETRSGLDYGDFALSAGIEREFTPESGFGGGLAYANGTVYATTHMSTRSSRQYSIPSGSCATSQAFSVW